MKAAIEFLVVIITLGLAAGPLGRIATNEPLATINLAVIVVWLSGWLREDNQPWRLAILIGLLFDLVSFQGFGIWTIGLTVEVFLIKTLKARLLEVSSVAHAALSLLIVTIFVESWLLLITRVTTGVTILAVNTLLTVIVGLLGYRLLGRGWQTFARRSGQRL